MSGLTPQHHNHIYVMPSSQPAANRKARKARESEEERAERRIYRTEVEAYLAYLRLEYREQLANQGQDTMIRHHRSRILKMRQLESDPIIGEQVFGFQTALEIDAHRLIGVYVNKVSQG